MNTTVDMERPNRHKLIFIRSLLVLSMGAAYLIYFNKSDGLQGTVGLQNVHWENVTTTKSKIQSTPMIEQSKKGGILTDSAGAVKQWKCCVDPLRINPLVHPNATDVQDKKHNYGCPKNPSNFSFSWPAMRETLIPRRWKNKTIGFVGGSTTRQMFEQLMWEMPGTTEATKTFEPFLFKQDDNGKGCCTYNRTHDIDLRVLAPAVVNALRSSDYVIVNVGTWWSSTTVGFVTDENGLRWEVDGGRKQVKQWHILDANISAINAKILNPPAPLGNATSQKVKVPTPPSVLFDHLMERALTMMQQVASPHTTIVWRSETHTDCPPGGTFRASLAPIAEALGDSCPGHIGGNL